MTNTNYIDANNKKAYDHFKALGCTFVRKIKDWQFTYYDYDGYICHDQHSTVAYYVYGNGFENMSKTGFSKYLKRNKLRLRDQR